MEISTKMQEVLARCKLMNCVYAGQSFSVGTLDDEFEGRDNVVALLDKMIEAELLSKGLGKTYTLTRAGEEALSSSTRTTKKQMIYAARKQPRPPINKL